jgi:hypothetical protein
MRETQTRISGVAYSSTASPPYPVKGTVTIHGSRFTVHTTLSTDSSPSVPHCGPAVCNMDSAPSPQSPLRSRTSNACASCRSRKVRCLRVPGEEVCERLVSVPGLAESWILTVGEHVDVTGAVSHANNLQ